LTTVTWGQRPDIPGSDIDTANRIARRFGTRHWYFPKTADNFGQQFAAMFAAQSGMTDGAAFHANELAVCRSLRADKEIKSIMRGDECFGFGPRIYTRQNALYNLCLSLAEFVPDRDKWFTEGSGRLFANYADQLSARLAAVPRAPNALKDTLYCRERLTMCLHPLNYFKLHYQDVYTPLIDPDVLAIVQTIPDSWRNEKRLYRMAFARRFKNQLDIPISRCHNLTDWDREIARRNELRKFLTEELDRLPTLLNHSFFAERLIRIRQESTQKPPALKTRIQAQLRGVGAGFVHRFLRWCLRRRDKRYTIGNTAYVFRAIVLGRWLAMMQRD
jgi:hypothetical protein